MNQRLYRSRDDRIIAGVAGGLAQQFRIDPSLVRILWVILVIPTGGLALLLYVVMAFVVPEEPAGDTRWASWDRGSGGNGWSGDAATTPADGSAPAAGLAGIGSPAAAPDGEPGSLASAEAAPTTGADTMGISPTPLPRAVSSPAEDGPLGVPPSFAGGGAGFAAGGGPGPGTDAWDPSRAERRAARHERRDGYGALLFGLILILVGAYFLVRAYVPAFDADKAWPFLLLGIGVVLLFGAIRRSNDSNGA